MSASICEQDARVGLVSFRFAPAAPRYSDLFLFAGIAPETGAGNRIRTYDPIITNDVLYQLSYSGQEIRRGRIIDNFAFDISIRQLIAPRR